MAKSFMTLDRAKKEIEKLQDYVELVESYQPQSIEQEIVREYALTSSIKAVTHKLGVEHQKVVEVLKKKSPKDKLHQFVRAGYLQKLKNKDGFY